MGAAGRLGTVGRTAGVAGGTPSGLPAGGARRGPVERWDSGTAASTCSTTPNEGSGGGGIGSEAGGGLGRTGTVTRGGGAIGAAGTDGAAERWVSSPSVTRRTGKTEAQIWHRARTPAGGTLAGSTR